MPQGQKVAIFFSIAGVLKCSELIATKDSNETVKIVKLLQI